CNFGNGNGRGIAGQNGMGGSKAVEFPENRQFDVFILSSSFNNQVGFFRPFSKGRKSSNVSPSCRSNVFANYPLTYLSSKILFDSAVYLFPLRRIPVYHTYLISIFCKYVIYAVSNATRTNNGYFIDYKLYIRDAKMRIILIRKIIFS